MVLGSNPRPLHAGVSGIAADRLREFLGSIPAAVRPFPAHPERAVRQIRLRHLYAAAVSGINYLIRLLECCSTADRHLLIGFFVGLETSSHPFLAGNPSIRAVVSWLIAGVRDSIQTDAAAPDFDLALLCDLHFAVPYLPAAQQAWLRPRLAQARRSLHLHRRRYLARQRRALEPASRRSGGAATRRRRIYWDQRLVEVLDQRHAQVLGLALDNDAYYRATVRELETIPFRRANALELFNLLTHTSYGLSLSHRRPMYGNPTAGRLCARGVAFLDWLRASGLYRDDPEVLAGCADAFLKGTSRAWNSTPHLGGVLRLVLDTQAADGSWTADGSEPAGLAEDDFYFRYHPVWICVDALRPLRNDLLNPENRRLGLV